MYKMAKITKIEKKIKDRLSLNHIVNGDENQIVPKESNKSIQTKLDN